MISVTKTSAHGVVVMTYQPKPTCPIINTACYYLHSIICICSSYGHSAEKHLATREGDWKVVYAVVLKATSFVTATIAETIYLSILV
jgi:hypothetical protein